jgi:hypothetical protein
VVGRSTLLNGCVPGLKEVRFVRSSSYGRVRFDRCSIFDVQLSVWKVITSTRAVPRRSSKHCKGGRSSDFLNKVAD